MISIERAKALRKVIEQAVSAYPMDDAEALAVKELYPHWKADGTYSTGDMVQYGGQLYRCINNHTAQGDWTPSAAVSLWDSVQIDPETGYDQWSQPTGAHDAYNTGDRVVYNGSVYESLIDGNTWAPDTYPAGWTKIE